MPERLLTDAELNNREAEFESDDLPREVLEGMIKRLIADHRRMSEAIRIRGHAHPDTNACYWTVGRDGKDCTRDNCIRVEIQP